MPHSRFLCAFASLVLQTCLFSCTLSKSLDEIQAQTEYSKSHDHWANSGHHPWQTDDDFEALDDTYWYVPDAYLKAYLYINGAQLPVLDQTVWHLQTARDPDRYIFGKSVATFFPANPPAGFQFTYGCNRMLGSITPSRSVYISFIPKDSANGTAVTTGLGSFGRFKGGWAFEMQMGSGTPEVLAAHWAYMLPCARDEPCFKSLPGVGMSIPDFMAKCGW